MTFDIKWHSNSRKFLRKLPSEIAKRIIKKIKDAKENPFRYLEHYEGEGYKFRIGDYRALIDVDFKNKILWVRIIGHRKNIYEK